MGGIALPFASYSMFFIVGVSLFLIVSLLLVVLAFRSLRLITGVCVGLVDCVAKLEDCPLGKAKLVH